MSWGTLNVLELLWIVIGLTAFYPAQRNFRQALTDRRAILMADLNGDLEELVSVTVWEEALRVAKSGVIVGVGVVAALTPPPPRQPITYAAVAVTVGIFMLGLLIMAGSLVAGRRWETKKEEHGMNSHGST